MGGHAEQVTDGHNPGAADPIDLKIKGFAQGLDAWDRQPLPCAWVAACLGGRCASQFTRFTAFNGNETRTKTVRTRIVLVAIRLVDLPLATQGGFERLDRQAIALRRTIATAFADVGIYDEALCRIRILLAVAATSFFAGTGLVVNKSGHARDFAQLPLKRIK